MAVSSAYTVDDYSNGFPVVREKASKVCPILLHSEYGDGYDCYYRDEDDAWIYEVTGGPHFKHSHRSDSQSNEL